jgi:hypothetical protein
LSNNSTTEKIDTNKGIAINIQGFLELKSGMRENMWVPFMCENQRVTKTLVFPIQISPDSLAINGTTQRKPPRGKTLPYRCSLSIVFLVIPSS